MLVFIMAVFAGRNSQDENNTNGESRLPASSGLAGSNSHSTVFDSSDESESGTPATPAKHTLWR